MSLVHPNSEVTILGAFHTKKSESLSVDLTIHHKAPRTKANTVLKGVAEDTSSIRFFGKIIIDPECGQSNSFLTERILLLSDSARAEAIPELEILTDDVKCSHAASVTSIPEEHVFYLMSRGLSKHQAERLVVDGFLELGE
ncbi:MAG: SufD family Fe-S cluster assembly protein [Pseudomonadales bacterium]|nr:SufD family Fe-S cluster assembly protein [Pseudomonadales bacterium]